MLNRDKTEENMKNQISLSAVAGATNLKGKFTPGPWKVWQQPTNTAFYEVSTDRIPQPSVGQTPIASCDRRENTQALANATLIAAAPELLEALKGLRWAIEGTVIEKEGDYQAEIEAADAAIDRAEGKE